MKEDRNAEIKTLLFQSLFCAAVVIIIVLIKKWGG